MSPTHHLLPARPTHLYVEGPTCLAATLAPDQAPSAITATR